MFIALILSAVPARSQSEMADPRSIATVPSSTLAQLAEDGLQNLSWYEASDGLVFTLEYRLARSPAFGVCRLLASTRRLAPHERISVMIHHTGVPTVVLTFEPVPFTASPGAEPTGSCPGYQLTGRTHRVSKFIRSRQSPVQYAGQPPLLDVVVGPSYGVRWGARWDLVELYAAVAPRLELNVLPGMQLTAEAIMPLWNELPGETGYLRPGLITAGQLIRLADASFARFAVGKFRDGRVGADLQIRSVPYDGRLAFGVDAGYTSGLTFPQGSLFVDPTRRTILLGNAAGYIPRYDLFIHASGGQFLYGDLGARLSVVRQFGGLDVGFSAAATEHGANAGFHVVLPILRGRASGHRHLRVRPEPFFAVRYDYYRDRDVAVRYRTGGGLDDLLQQHHPIVLSRRLGAR